MRQALLLFLLCLLKPSLISTQPLYFPPLTGEIWATTDAATLNWCPEKLDSLYAYLAAVDTKSFLILKDGKIVVEKYFGSYTRDSIWYYASAAKSVTAVLVGLAQQEGLLNIEDRTSQYLGTGWTSLPPDKEDLITIRHQLTMTTGLDESEENLGGNAFCLDPDCLKYTADAGTRWAYHNAPYRLLQDVVVSTSNLNFNQFFRRQLGNKIGMSGFWFNYILFGKARDMARFGLLILANGHWDGSPILTDPDYFKNMTTPSQTLNPAYGYLWWLNGQERFKIPGLQIDFSGALIPEGPDDMIAALGRDDQKIYVVPSLNMVVVRQGTSAGPIAAAPSSFDNQVWQRILDLECAGTPVKNIPAVDFKVFPNPVFLEFTIDAPIAYEEVRLSTINGQQLAITRVAPNRYRIENTSYTGIFILKIKTAQGIFYKKLLAGNF